MPSSTTNLKVAYPTQRPVSLLGGGPANAQPETPDNKSDSFSGPAENKQQQALPSGIALPTADQQTTAANANAANNNYEFFYDLSDISMGITLVVGVGLGIAVCLGVCSMALAVGIALALILSLLIVVGIIQTICLTDEPIAAEPTQHASKTSAATKTETTQAEMSIDKAKALLKKTFSTDGEWQSTAALRMIDFVYNCSIRVWGGTISPGKPSSCSNLICTDNHIGKDDQADINIYFVPGHYSRITTQTCDGANIEIAKTQGDGNCMLYAIMGSHPAGQALDKELTNQEPTEDLLHRILEQIELLGQELIESHKALQPRTEEQQQRLAKLSKMYIYAEHLDRIKQATNSRRQKKLDAAIILAFINKPLKISQNTYEKISTKNIQFRLQKFIRQEITYHVTDLDEEMALSLAEPNQHN